MKKILVIEDEALIRINILECLENAKFKAIGAENGVNGINLAGIYQPDLIICDIIMPDIDGYAVLTALRQNPVTVTTPFIFLSAKSERDDMRLGMERGADDYITKPLYADGTAKRDRYLKILQQECARELAILNQLSTWQDFFTPQTIRLLHKFNISEQSNP